MQIYNFFYKYFVIIMFLESILHLIKREFTNIL